MHFKKHKVADSIALDLRFNCDTFKDYLMKHNMKQDDSVFTYRGAIIGFFAYVIVISIILWVFY